ncbi:hypothetical protein AVEN_50536-1 [Araneus ventricosus]|uniref:Uncharacterized protein n=1 Tax=Araneus ventricosus TaxID=182803 RepID=A0A4Y2APW8_ARAVE|nr:hypothetical protein AVEN_50536-1 [Araneus ventricosus]
MGQDWGCRPGAPISSISGDECVLLCFLLCGVLDYCPRTNPLKAYCHPCSFVIGVRSYVTNLHLFPVLKSSLSGRHFRSNEGVRLVVKKFLRSL